MSKIRNLFKVSSVIIATLVGAGFATGQEIFTFFNRFGRWSFVGIVFAFFLLYFAFYSVLKCCCLNEITDVRDYFNRINRPVARTIAQVCIMLFCFVCYSAMLSGAAELLHQNTSISYGVGIVLSGVLFGFVLSKDIDGVADVNFVLAPLICVGLLLYSFGGIMFRSVSTIQMVEGETRYAQIIWSAVLYVSYNFLSSIAVLCSTAKFCKDIRTVRLSCLIGVFVLFIIAISIWLVLSIYLNKIELGSMPLLDIAARKGMVAKHVYGGLLYASILTTALANGHGCVVFLKNSLHISPTKASVFLSCVAIPISFIGFEGIIRVFYTIFGYLGLPILAFVLLYNSSFNFFTKNSVKINRK